MDLKTERKIKFWVAIISKVLVIALILFKLVEHVFDKEQIPVPEQEILTTNLEENQSTDSALKKPSLPKQRDPVTLQKSTKKEEKQTNTAPTQVKVSKPIYAKLQLVEDSFIWQKKERKFVLKLSNNSAAIAENVVVTAVLIYEKEQQTIPIQQKASVDAHGTLQVDFISSNALHSALPKTIMLCINHGNKNTKRKNWYKYLLGNKIAGSGPIETRSVNYKTLSVSEGVYTSSPPNCVLKTKKSNVAGESKDDLLAVENITSTARLFVRGLNSKSLITIKSTTTARLYGELSSLESNTYSYGFSNAIEVVSHNKSTAIVKLILTEHGRTNYIQQQAAYTAENNSKKVSSFFKFLNQKGSYWEGKLVNQNGIWKFDAY